ncbi:MAG: DUF2207 domain-containing protein, partial [Methanomicrobiales archaeon]
MIRLTGGFGANLSKPKIENLALSNEVGVFNPDYYPAGKFSVEDAYVLHTPIEYDMVSTHLNLKLAGE